jgi:hypothetical protein
MACCAEPIPFSVRQGCEFETPRERQPLEFFEIFEAKLNETRDDIVSLVGDFESIGLQAITERLDYNMTEVEVTLQELREDLVLMVEQIKGLLSSLVCQDINAIYDKVIHDATCTESYFGLAWTYSSLLIMTFFGFLMLQFRAAMYPLAGLEDDDNYSWNNAKEKEMASGNDNDNYKGTDEDAPAGYTQDEGLQSNNQPEGEVPMGGTAQERYDAVGDDNPFAENSGQENFKPKQSPWG